MPYVAELEAPTRTQAAHGLQVFHGDDGLEVASNSTVAMGGAKSEVFSEENEPKQRRRMWCFIIAGVLLLVVIAVSVVGGVLGSRYNHRTPTTSNATATTSSATSPAIPSASPSTTSSPVYASSSIGVTGWWTGASSFSIRLVYQGEDGYLRLMQYNSGDSSWSTMTTLTTLDARLGSPFAISAFNGTLFFNRPVISTNVSRIASFPHYLFSVSNAR